MSFFSEASLAMIPSGYKTSKVYSAIPTSGDGDLTFSRSNDTATRVASNGLIEKVRTNLILQSEAFNTTWTDNAATVTPNTTANPLNGALTADTITLGAGTVIKYLQQSVTAFNGLITHSVYLKAGTHQFIQLLSAETTVCANFDLVNGTASSVSSTAQIVALANGWYRCSISYTATISPSTVYIWAVDSLAATRAAATASTGTFIAFGYQHETGDIATDYIATTTAAVSVGPVANLPRLDYLGSSCPRLLLEPQRTNLLQYSEQIDNAFWAKSNVTISANAVTSPDGYTNADNLVENTATAVHGVGNLTGLTLTAVPYTFSVFVKKQNRNFFVISTFDGSTTLDGYFNINTGAVATMPAGMTGTITNYGNGWYRCTATRTMGANSDNYFGFNAADTDGSSTYLGTGVVACSIYGGSLELGAYATSYIPTLGAAVTRGEDACSKTGISSLFGSAFTIFVDVLKLQDTGPTRYLVAKGTGGTYDNWIAFEKVYEGVSLIVTDENAATLVNINKANIPVGQRMKIAARCENGSYAFYVNGEQIGVSSAAFTPAVSSFDFHYYDYLGTQTYNQAMILQPLTNAQLAELTTI
jgi:hypothetical protein